MVSKRWFEFCPECKFPLSPFYLNLTSILPLFHLFFTFFNLNLTSASLRISNHGLETTVYRLLECGTATRLRVACATLQWRGNWGLFTSQSSWEREGRWRWPRCPYKRPFHIWSWSSQSLISKGGSKDKVDDHGNDHLQKGSLHIWSWSSEELPWVHPDQATIHDS